MSESCGRRQSFRTIVGTASKDVPRDLATFAISIQEKAVTAKEVQENLKDYVRRIQANIEGLRELGVEFAAHERHDGLLQTCPCYKYERDKDPVLEGYVCTWSSVIQTRRVELAAKVVERLYKNMADAKTLKVRASFSLAEGTAQKVARELFDAARDDARQQLRAESVSLGFDATRCRIVCYGEPEQEGGAMRSYVALAGATRRVTDDGDDGRTEALELHPGTQRVGQRIAFAFETDEAVFVLPKHTS